MILTLDDIPVKTPIGMQYTVSPKNFPHIEVSSLLRRLLIIVDGRRSVQDLLESGLAGADIQSVQQLLAHGLIAPRDYKPKAVPVAPAAKVSASMQGSDTGTAAPLFSKSRRSFSSLRFDVLDLLLNLSMQDFSAKQWVAQFEQAGNQEELLQLAQQFCQSALAGRYPAVVQQLKTLLD